MVQGNRHQKRISCPKDADEGNQRWCLISSLKGRLCTRKKGHTGTHHAHGIDKKCIETWEVTL